MKRFMTRGLARGLARGMKRFMARGMKRFMARKSPRPLGGARAQKAPLPKGERGG